jgi:hypothetical protein
VPLQATGQDDRMGVTVNGEVGCKMLTITILGYSFFVKNICQVLAILYNIWYNLFRKAHYTEKC